MIAKWMLLLPPRFHMSTERSLHCYYSSAVFIIRLNSRATVFTGPNEKARENAIIIDEENKKNDGALPTK